MSMNVREAFLNHAENNGFQILRETATIIGEPEINFDLAPFFNPSRNKRRADKRPTSSSKAVEPRAHSSSRNTRNSARETIQSLSNAFTSAFKELDPISQFKATAKLGEFLEAGSHSRSRPQERAPASLTRV